jgi:Cu/Ag efflux protein CusF
MIEGTVSETEAKATVKDIDYKTRKITLKSLDDGEEFSFVASERVKNLNQVKKGDIVTASYTEALVYDIHKGGKEIRADETTMSKTVRPGNKPEGIIERQITASVLISAIDQKAPSVTFKNANGDAKTIKVKDPARLEGVKVGDTVELTYMEALALKIEKASKQ